MAILPEAPRGFWDDFAPIFTRPTCRRFLPLIGAAILTVGRRTVANLLRTAGPLAVGSASSYTRVFSRARWSPLRLAEPLTRRVVALLPPGAEVVLVADDTVFSHPGRRVFGKARHRDPVRSSHAFTAWRYGHKWVVLAVLVRLPYAARPWALPVLVALYRDPADDRRERRRHRTPAQQAIRLVRLMLHWFPRRRFVFVGDSAYGAHELARFADRNRERLTLVSKLHPEANLFEPPPPYDGLGRPRVKGERLPKPRQAVEATPRRRRTTVAWYGGGTRRVETATGAGRWYKGGDGLVPIRWAFVHDRDGTHRDEYFYATDASFDVRRIVEAYRGRWSIETTFQEARSELHVQTTRGWSEPTVLRAVPRLFGLYSVVAMLYAWLPKRRRAGGVSWPGKSVVTFSDALRPSAAGSRPRGFSHTSPTARPSRNFRLRSARSSTQPSHRRHRGRGNCTSRAE
ncbi:transposase [Paludisphaera sp.]|uniref:IS701 family transposase n=1 Tax=Paludisphaera sp. TaxID=2017432 RepID=UPI00301CDAE2